MAGRGNAPKVERYGFLWEPYETDLSIEMQAIRLGGTWKSARTGKECGLGLFHHYKRMISILWPQYVWHRWSEIQLKTMLENRIVGILGPASSGKTCSAAVYVLSDFYCWSDCTTVLVSSTEKDMLELRIFGEIKKFHSQAKNDHDGIPGNLIESRQKIITDNKWDAEDGRDFRNGICGVPIKKGGAYQGMGSFVGVKNKRVRMVADELSLCPRVFVDAISNLNKNHDFKCVGLGNPKDTTDALGIFCEPSGEIGGWDGGIDQQPKTKTWTTRFDKGICLQLPGSDCPNMDVGPEDPVPFPFLITREAIAADIKFYGQDSLQYSMMNEGRMPRGQGLRRVITRQMVEKFGAKESAVWMNDKHTKVAFLDAAYGAIGGDRCMFGELWFGKDPNDKEILEIKEMSLVPVSVNVNEMPEDQIAMWVKDQCVAKSIPPENFFFDSTGRGSLVGAFARIWSPHVGLVEFGGVPSERYVSDGIKVLCKDYFYNFVSELWFAIPHTIQSGQFRGMTEELMTEGTAREWGFVGKNKIQVEPKDKMKVKIGRSPDAFDALVCGLEGARRKGFVIQRLMLSNPAYSNNPWKNRYADRMEALEARSSLNYS